MISIRRALALSFIERYVLIAIALLGSMLVARLLTPEEIGVYSVSLALIGVAQVVRDFGLGNFLIQEKDLTEAHIRTVFGFAILIGWILFVLVFLAAPTIADFYADERLLQTLRISSLNFLILPFCSISLSLLRREMAFNRLIKVNLIAASSGLVTTVSLSYAGFGPNSLAIGGVAVNVVTGIGAWLARTDRKFLLPGISEWRKVLNFGGQSSLAAIVTTVAMDINDLALGKILGFASVAIISRGQGLMNLFHRDVMAAIRNVIYPNFAKIYREGSDLEEHYLKVVANVTVIAWPFYMYVSFFSLEIIRLLFGTQWDQAAGLVPWFCVAGAAAATCNLILPLLIARGRIDLATQVDLTVQPIRAAILVIGVMIFPKVEVFAYLFTAVFVFSVPYYYHVKSKSQANDLKNLIALLLKSLAITFICSMPAILALLNTKNSLVSMIDISLSAVFSVVIWLLAIFILKHPLANDLHLRIGKAAIRALFCKGLR